MSTEHGAVTGPVERGVMSPVPACGVRPIQEDDRPLVTRILQALPKQPSTPHAGWARYKNECADFVDRLRSALKQP